MSLKYWIKKTHKKQVSFSRQHKNLRWFVAILAIISLLYLLFFNSSENRLLPSLIVLSGAVIILIVPRLISPILYLWMWVGGILGEIIAFTFFVVIYYLVLFPISWFIKKQVELGWQKKDTFGEHSNMY